MGAAGVEGEEDFLLFFVPIEGIFHFVAVIPLDTIGLYGGDFKGFREGDVSLAKGFFDEEAFLL